MLFPLTHVARYNNLSSQKTLLSRLSHIYGHGPVWVIVLLAFIFYPVIAISATQDTHDSAKIKHNLPFSIKVFLSFLAFSNHLNYFETSVAMILT